jgi:RsmE family RNA methyltransferase
MNLLILTPEDVSGDATYRVSGRRLEHMRAVLRLEAGDAVEIGLLNGPQGIGRIRSINQQEASIEIERFREQRVPKPTIDLICAMPRPKILRKVLYVAGMCGIGSLHLVRTNRTEKSYLLSPLLVTENYQPYLLEGLSQGRQTRLPSVLIHPLFRPFVEDDLPKLEGYPDAFKLLADLKVEQWLDGVMPKEPPERLLLAIGPEGGLVEFERDLLVDAGFKPFLLGKSTLRVEFALMAALAQIELVCHGR